MTNTISPITHSPSHTFLLVNCPAILRMHRVLIERLTRVLPTRQKILTQPTVASLVPFDDLALSVPVSDSATQVLALTLFLPIDFLEHLPALGARLPRLRMQVETGPIAKGAYVSWETGHGEPPLTAWVEAHTVLAALEANREVANWPVLPLLLVADDTVIVTKLAPDEAWLAEAQFYVDTAKLLPVDVLPDLLKKAAVTVEKYSEQPWSFMRHELKNGNERLAVNFAPVQRMHVARAE